MWFLIGVAVGYAIAKYDDDIIILAAKAYDLVADKIRELRG